MFEYSQSPMHQAAPVTQMNPAAKDLKSQYQAIANAPNPAMLIEQLKSTNQQFKQTYDMVQSLYNGDGKKAFMTAAKAKGMTDDQINQFLAQLK